MKFKTKSKQTMLKDGDYPACWHRRFAYLPTRMRKDGCHTGDEDTIWLEFFWRKAWHISKDGFFWYERTQNDPKSNS
jgi:hypothetical protein